MPKSPESKYSSYAKRLRLDNIDPSNVQAASLQKPFNSLDYVGTGARHSGQFANPQVAGSEYDREMQRTREDNLSGKYFAPSAEPSRIDSYSTQGILDALGLDVNKDGRPILAPRDEYLLNEAEFDEREDATDPELPRQKMLRKLLFGE